jgi:segregation and condensation protein A
MTNDTEHRLHRIRAEQGGQATLALVRGERVDELPKDLYIPPHALEVFLETFEGPLDLLLYLIRRENLDILEIKVAEITEQYMSYIGLMNALQLELAGEYLVMAAMLAEIKSRLLLPRPVDAEDDEEDPRAELIRRLQEYEQIKSAAENIEELPRLERDIHLAHAGRPELVREHADPEVDLKDVLIALAHVLRRAEMFEHHAVQLEPLSVRERMSGVLARVNESRDFVPFGQLFTPEEGRRGVVVTFLALMELVRESLVDFVQNEAFGPIYVRAAGEGTHGAA